MVEGYIAHITKGRIRIRFPSQKGNNDFFLELMDKLKNENFQNLRVNTLTGSLIIEHDKTNEEILEFMNSQHYFKITDSVRETPESKIIKSVHKNVAYVNDLMKKVSSGALNLRSAILIFLILNATYQIARGHIATIPWYAALFYLYVLISKK